MKRFLHQGESTNWLAKNILTGNAVDITITFNQNESFTVEYPGDVAHYHWSQAEKGQIYLENDLVMYTGTTELGTENHKILFLYTEKQ